MLRTRHLRGTDTDWDWLTSSPLLTDARSARLTPYYWLGVIALGVHGAAGLRYLTMAHGVSERMANRLFVGAIFGAVLASSLIVTGMIVGSKQN